MSKKKEAKKHNAKVDKVDKLLAIKADRLDKNTLQKLLLDDVKTSQQYPHLFDKKPSIFNEDFLNKGKTSITFTKKITSFYCDFTNRDNINSKDQFDSDSDDQKNPNNLHLFNMKIKSNVKYQSIDHHKNSVVSKFQGDSDNDIELSGDNTNNEG